MMVLVLVLLSTLPHPLFSSLPRIPCGSFDISSTTSTVRLLSHVGFNKRTRYANQESCTWKLEVGEWCACSETDRLCAAWVWV